MSYSKPGLLKKYHKNSKSLINIREKRNLQIFDSQPPNKKNPKFNKKGISYLNNLWF